MVVSIIALCDQIQRSAILFFPGLFYNFFLFWLIYGGLGLGSYIGFLGLGFSVDGVWACARPVGWGLLGFFG